MLRRLTKFEVDIFFLQDVDKRILNMIYKKTDYRIVQSSFGKSAILISWEGMKKLVGEDIRTFKAYNMKFFDPLKEY